MTQYVTMEVMAAKNIAEIFQILHDTAKATEVKLLERLTKDFEYEISWVADDLYKASYVAKEYRMWIKACENPNLDITIDGLIKEYTDFLSRPHNVVTSSTSIITRETSIWKYQSVMEMVQLWKAIKVACPTIK